MATESLIVELDARTKKLDAKLKATENKLDKLAGTTKKADKSLAKMGKAAGVAGSILVKTTAAAVALGAAISAMVLSASSGRKELERFARQAKTSTENFQALSFATKQYGINAEQIADISKDIADKVGEFAAAGTGTFQDYADVMKLTKEEARSLATEFQSLSSEQIIGKMVSEMEGANVAGDQMTFVLESMGNDLSKLIPLFSSNSAELKTMKSRFDEVNSSLQITAGQAEKLKEVSTSFDLLTSGLGNAATAISATIAPVVDDFFNDVIDIVPDATQTIIDFVNSFLDAENITSIAAINKEIIKSQEQIAEKTELIANTNGRNQKVQRILLDEENERLATLEAQLVVLQEQETLADAKRREGGEIGGTIGGTGGTGDEKRAIEDRFKTEEELLREKLAAELIIIGDDAVLRFQLEEQLLDDLFELDLAFREKKLTARREADSKEKKEQDKLQKDKDKQNKIDGKIAKQNADKDELFAKNSMAIASLVFEDNKAVSAGIALVNTAQGVTKALASQDYAGAALTAVVGAAQISAILGASKGGGTVPSVAATAPSTPDFQPETNTASLDVTEQTETGVTQRFVMVDGSGNDLVEFISMGQDERARNGG